MVATHIFRATTVVSPNILCQIDMNPRPLLPSKISKPQSRGKKAEVSKSATVVMSDHTYTAEARALSPCAQKRHGLKIRRRRLLGLSLPPSGRRSGHRHRHRPVHVPRTVSAHCTAFSALPAPFFVAYIFIASSPHRERFIKASVRQEVRGLLCTSRA